MPAWLKGGDFLVRLHRQRIEKRFSIGFVSGFLDVGPAAAGRPSSSDLRGLLGRWCQSLSDLRGLLNPLEIA